ncbi:MAG: protein kinase [Acidobacteria bacterium]|nr:protein kinase [Acidobacteriota bacterium]
METIEKGGTPGGDVAIAVFLAAVSRPEAEREAFVREACGADERLLSAVLRRLNWEQRMKGFLLTPMLTRERMDRPFAMGESVLRGRYRIVRVAGEGGMSVVYEAWDEKLGRQVALKCPRFEFRKRLTEEARKSLLVNHANVCRVFEIHTEETPTGDVDFLTMEFIEGETLGARLRRVEKRWLRTREGLDVARQICEGLQAVHDAAIVHRDLKAGNVMLSQVGTGSCRAVITDFGIAQDSDVFHSDRRGTPSYLAPELWMGHSATVQSDIYALGVLLYEMEFGCGPFPDGASWRERLYEPPRVPGSDRVSALLKACLAPDPRQRPRRASEVKRRLFQPSRRAMVAAGFAATGCVLAGRWAKENWWPSSIVRLAVLPARGPAGDDWRISTGGFLHDVSYRFQTLRGARRPLVVLDVAQTAKEEAAGFGDAKARMGATHAIVTDVRRDGTDWNVSAALVDATNGQRLREWRPVVSGRSLDDQIFALQTRVVQDSIEELRLQAKPRAQDLTPAVYADYTQGVYLARVDYENAQRAIPYFERVIAAAPDSALGYAGLAEALIGTVYQSGDTSLHTRALAALERAERLDPELAHVHLVRGRLNHFMGQFQRARADFQRAAELDPNDAQALLGIGWELHYLGRNREAETPFRMAMERHPSYYKPYLDAGIFYYELRNFQRAEQLWREAMRLHPTNSRIQLNLAVLCVETDRLVEAERFVQASLQASRTLAAVELFGDIRERQDRNAEAIAAYEEALRVGPPLYKTWGALAMVYRKVGDEANATRVFRRGLEQAEDGVAASPRDPERLAWCAYYHAAVGNEARARARVVDTLAVANKPAGRIRKRLVLAFDLLGDREAALGLLAGAPRELLREIARSPGVSPELRKNRRLEEAIRN